MKNRMLLWQFQNCYDDFAAGGIRRVLAQEPQSIQTKWPLELGEIKVKSKWVKLIKNVIFCVMTAQTSSQRETPKDLLSYQAKVQNCHKSQDFGR